MYTPGGIHCYTNNSSTAYNLLEKQTSVCKVQEGTKIYNKLYCCNKCQYKTVHKDNLAKHFVRHEVDTKESALEVPQITELKCQQCDAQFQSERNLISHKRKVHMEISCNVCGKQFTNRQSKSKHLKNIHGVNAKGNVVLRPVKTKVSCEFCDKQFHSASNLKRHKDTIHLNYEENPNLYCCYKCQYKTPRKDNLANHINRHENDTEESASEVSQVTKLKCPNCEAQFQCNRNLNWHKSKVHLTIKRNLRICRKCPICPFTSSTYLKKEIHKHFEEDHNLNMKWEQHEFRSLNEFQIWKEVIEKTTVTSYVSVRGLSNEYLAYQCNRCGNYKPQSRGIRNTKLKGSCKINSFCPSEIIVHHKGETIKVKYLAEHVGHTKQLEYIRLRVQDRVSIAQMLINKVPKKEILRIIRSIVGNPKLQRLQLVNSADIDNIRKSLKLEDDWKKHRSDFVSTNARLAEFKQSKNPSVHVVCRNMYPSTGPVETQSSPDLIDDLNIATLPRDSQPETDEFKIRKSTMFEQFKDLLTVLEAKVTCNEQLDFIEKEMKKLESVVEAIDSTHDIT